MPLVQVFAYLQVLDLLTTIVAFRVGLLEAGPIPILLMHLGPVLGLAVTKCLALALAAVCLWLRRRRVLCWANYFFAAVVVWNLVLIVVTLHKA